MALPVARAEVAEALVGIMGDPVARPGAAMAEALVGIMGDPVVRPGAAVVASRKLIHEFLSWIFS